MSEEIEFRRVLLDEEKVRGELAIQREELELRRRELEARERELSRGALHNPLILAIVAALTGFLGNLGASFLQAQNALELETKRFESTKEAKQIELRSQLIVDSLKALDERGARENLTFVIDAGLLDDPRAPAPRASSCWEAPLDIAGFQL